MVKILNNYPLFKISFIGSKSTFMFFGVILGHFGRFLDYFYMHLPFLGQKRQFTLFLTYEG